MLIHNVSQVIMWALLLVLLVNLDYETAYDNQNWRILLNTAQTMQFLDVVFSLAGLVKNNIVQVAGRYFIMLFYIYIVFPVCGSCHWVTSVVIALCLTEVSRYLFYTGYFSALSGFLRYNLFIIIMPVNQITEFMTCWQAF